MDQFSLFVAFIAGLVSFLSPCVLPIIPGFLAYLAGSAVEGRPPKRRDIVLASLFFVLGFSAVFSLLGVLLNTVLEAAAYSVQLWLARIGGGIIILFGLYLTGLLKFPLLEREYKFAVHRTFGSRPFTAFLFGAAFAAGWTPCVGAVLGGILGLAASAPGSAFVLLLMYSLGLGIPFLLVGFFASHAASAITRLLPFLVYFRILFGILLIIVGVLAFTESLGIVANLEILNSFLLQ